MLLSSSTAILHVLTKATHSRVLRRGTSPLGGRARARGRGSGG